MRILHNKEGCADGRIFNLGNPASECSILELADKLAALYRAKCFSMPGYVEPRIEVVAGDKHYGAGYQDILARKPSIAAARTALGWEPKIALDDAIARTFDSFLAEWQESQSSLLRTA